MRCAAKLGCEAEADPHAERGVCRIIDVEGGEQTFAASAQALGQSGESRRSKRGLIHEYCRRSNLMAVVSSDFGPILTLIKAVK